MVGTDETASENPSKTEEGDLLRVFLGRDRKPLSLDVVTLIVPNLIRMMMNSGVWVNPKKLRQSMIGIKLRYGASLNDSDLSIQSIAIASNTGPDSIANYYAMDAQSESLAFHLERSNTVMGLDLSKETSEKLEQATSTKLVFTEIYGHELSPDGIVTWEVAVEGRPGERKKVRMKQFELLLTR